MTGSERYFFVHLQKTAGTSLNMALRRQFGAEAMYPLPEDVKSHDAVLDVDHLRSVFAREGHRIRVVTGHFPYCTTELLGGSFRTFTILREPVARTLSFLRHQQRLLPDLADMPLEEIYARPRALHGLIHNHMVKMLGLTPELMTHGALTFTEFDHGYLERAKANLAKIDVWGLQEDYSSFQRELESTFGWDLGPETRTNTTEPRPVSEEFTERILRDNALDVELYRHAAEMHASRVEPGV